MNSAWIVVGLGYGDEGKGTIVDALVRKTGARVVVRFNGGGQAAHNVVTPDGRHHTFSQWGAGTFAGARTVLTKDFVMDPLAMIEEAKHLGTVGIDAPLSLLEVDERALITTPFHAAMNQIREIARGDARHGTCGVGIGEAVSDSLDPAVAGAELRAGDLLFPETLERKLRLLQQRKLAEASMLVWKEAIEAPLPLMRLQDETMFREIVVRMQSVGRRVIISPFTAIARRLESQNLVLEGAQGILLDEWHGFHPHTTWSTTTSENARAFVATIGDTQPKVIGVTRWYATRHGAGPFPTEQPGMDPPFEEHNNGLGRQGKFRVGYFDEVATRYAIESDGCIDALAVTCCDHAWAGPRLRCANYETDRGRVLKLKARRYHAKDDTHLEEQRRLGEFLRTVKPNYEAFSEHGSRGGIVDALGKPVLVESHGPTCDDKRWLDFGMSMARVAG
jgi:adenylosuccinate synthase